MNYETALDTLRHADPILGNLIDRVGPCKLSQAQQPGDVFDSLSRSILYQQLSTKSATTIYQRFLQLYGNSLVPAEVLKTPDETLRGVGLSRQKILYLKDLAQKVLDGLPTIAELGTLEDDAIVETLTQVKGIGKWTVQMLLIFRLHRWDVLPVDDLGVRAGIKRIYNRAELPTRKEVEAIAEPWRPYRTIASWYLWRSGEI